MYLLYVYWLCFTPAQFNGNVVPGNKLHMTPRPLWTWQKPQYICGYHLHIDSMWNIQAIFWANTRILLLEKVPFRSQILEGEYRAILECFCVPVLLATGHPFIHSCTPRTLHACCSQSELKILNILEGRVHALVLYNCTLNIIHMRVRFIHLLLG